MKRIRHALHHLGGPQTDRVNRRVNARVQLIDRLDRAGIVRTDHRVRRVIEILDGAALTQEFRVEGHVNRNAARVLLEDGDAGVGRAGKHGRADHHRMRRALPRDGRTDLLADFIQVSVIVAAVRVRRRADRDDRKVRLDHGLRPIDRC